MFEAFRLKRSIGRDMSVDLDDTLATKKALHTLGHFQTPPYGLTEYPDQAMIDGLKSFQRAHGLQVDGVMRPDGPTHRKLNLALMQPRSEPVASYNRPHYERPPAPTRHRLPLILKQPVKASASVELDDALKVKTALADLGLLPSSKDGHSPYPDGALFDAVEAFQRQSGLRVDGEMAPDGPTVRKINAALKEQESAKVTATPRAPEATDRTRVAQVAFPPGATPVVPGSRGAAGSGGMPGTVGNLPPSYRYRSPDVDWADAWSRLPDEVQNRILQIGSLPLATKTFLEGLTASREKRLSPTHLSPAARTQIADPLPPVPPAEPPRDEDQLPDRTELPPADALPSPKGRPVVDDELRTMIGGYPNQSDDELMQMLILESRGDDYTKEDNVDIVDISHEVEESRQLKSEHDGGALTWPDRNYKKETFMHGTPERRAVRSDVRKSVYNLKGQRVAVDFQTYTKRADGTPIPDELDAKARILAWYVEQGIPGIVVMIPKSRGKDRERWKANVRKIMNVLYDRIENEDYRPIDGWAFWED